MRPAGRPRLGCGRAIGRAGRAVVAAGVAVTVACPMVCQDYEALFCGWQVLVADPHVVA